MNATRYALVTCTKCGHDYTRPHRQHAFTLPCSHCGGQMTATPLYTREPRFDRDQAGIDVLNETLEQALGPREAPRGAGATTPHDHTAIVPGCFRCELGRDEASS